MADQLRSQLSEAPVRPDGTGTEDRPSLRGSFTFAGPVFLAVGLVLYLVVWVAGNTSRSATYPVAPLSFGGSSVLEGWVRFDGGWYAEIADHGYSFVDVEQQAPVAFFPAYPLTMRAFGWLAGDVLVAGILITLVCGLASCVLLHRWCSQQLSRRAADSAVLTLVLFPFAWYLFGAVYADALFLAFALLAFLLLQQDRPVLAGLSAAVATAARPLGLAVVVGLLAVMLETRGAVVMPYFDGVRRWGWRRSAWPAEAESGRIRVQRGSLRLADAGVLFAPVGLILWMSYLWARWDDPLLFAHIEGASGWDQSSGPRTWFKISLIERVGNLPDYVGGSVPHAGEELAYTLGICLQAVLVVGAVFLIPRIVRKVGWGYGLYVVALVALPVLGSKDFQGSGRYLLAAFPAFAVCGDWLAARTRPAVRYAVWATSGLLLVVLTQAYARAFYVA